MATVGTDYLTLSDWAKRVDPNGKIDKIVEILNETNEILDSMIWKEGNLPTGHRSTQRVGLPTPTYRLLNSGVPDTHSQTIQIDDACAMLEDYAEVDKDLADLNGNTSEFRLSEDKAHIEGFNQKLATSIFYGNGLTDPEEFTGLAPRFNDTSATNGGQIIDAGGTGSDNTSIWLVIWGDAVHGIFPKASKAGLTHQDLGEQTLRDANSLKYQGYRAHYQFKPGLTVRDWRYVVRIANIDVSDMTKNAATGADLIDLLVQAVELPPNLTSGKPVFYCNKTIRSMLRRQITNKSNVWLSKEEVAGRKVIAFDDIPVNKCDKILNTESQVT